MSCNFHSHNHNVLKAILLMFPFKFLSLEFFAVCLFIRWWYATVFMCVTVCTRACVSVFVCVYVCVCVSPGVCLTVSLSLFLPLFLATLSLSNVYISLFSLSPKSSLSQTISLSIFPFSFPLHISSSFYISSSRSLFLSFPLPLSFSSPLSVTPSVRPETL